MSGRRLCLETPVAASTARTRSTGTSRHCEMACGAMPSLRARAVIEPAARTASWRGSDRMGAIVSHTFRNLASHSCKASIVEAGYL